MKCQSLFSGKNINLSSAESAESMMNVNAVKDFILV